jgi:NADPH-dependent 2,4-dienoyl-CoA reductase/sulfur reductase-like enzyme
MAKYEYVILGGGMTAAAAVTGIRHVDQDGSIGLISAENDPPYDRPPLSKGLWKGKSEDKVFRPIEAHQVDLHLGRTVVRLDPDAHQLTDAAGDTYGYDKLLLATGGSPRQLPFGGESILYYRTLEDYHRLRRLSKDVERFAVIGGGFIGSELAAALAMQGRQVTMLFPEPAVGAGRFPTDLAAYLNQYYQDHGVDVLAGETLVGVEQIDDGLHLTTGSNRRMTVDAVVAGLGIKPSSLLAETAGLEVNDGIVVSPSLQTTNPDIYAAGDVARFHNAALDTRMRVEHEDNANTMGELAGRSMAGESVTYDHQPFFYSDMFDHGYEAVGVLDDKLDIVADWQEENEKGVVYYLKQGRPLGVLLWNVWGKVDEARQLLAAGQTVEPAELKGRIA